MFTSFGNSFFDNFDDILRAKTIYRSIVLAWYSPHEAVTARQAPFRTRRVSGTRLMRHVLISAQTQEVSPAQRRAFTAGAKDARRFS